MVQRDKLPPMVPTFHGCKSQLLYFGSSSLLMHPMGNGPSAQAPAIHVRDLDRDPGSWLQAGPVSTSAAIQRVNQQI